MLDDRKSAILRAVVQQYIETAQPVGSGAIAADPDVSVSPATVRNEMTSLERDGYLVQPHTSAGRIPTEKGYRFFVDSLGDPADFQGVEVRQVTQFFSHAQGELEGLLRSASHLLSRLTATAAVVVGEPDASGVVRSVQLVGMSATSVLVVAVVSTGDVLKRTIDRPEGATDDVLADAQALAAAALVGRAVTDSAGPAPEDSTVAAVLARNACVVMAGAIGPEQHRMYVDGTSQIAGAFDAADTVREVLVILEQQLTVVSLLHDVLDRGLSVAIGSETGVAPLSECSVVVAPFLIDGAHAGTIGVLGPTRMNYRDTLAAVGAVSSQLSKMLTEG